MGFVEARTSLPDVPPTRVGNGERHRPGPWWSSWGAGLQRICASLTLLYEGLKTPHFLLPCRHISRSTSRAEKATVSGRLLG